MTGWSGLPQGPPEEGLPTVEIVAAPPNKIKVVTGRRATWVYKWYASGAEGRMAFHKEEAAQVGRALLGGEWQPAPNEPPDPRREHKLDLVLEEDEIEVLIQLMVETRTQAVTSSAAQSLADKILEQPNVWFERSRS